MGDSRRVLIVTWEGGGNVPPAVALGQRLGMEGHRVTLLGASSDVVANGETLKRVPFTSVPTLPPGQTFEENDGLFRDLLNGDGTASDIMDAAARERPDVLVIDCMMGAAHAAAERLGLPTAVLVHVLYRPFVDIWGQFVLDAAAPRLGLGLSPT